MLRLPVITKVTNRGEMELRVALRRKGVGDFRILQDLHKEQFDMLSELIVETEIK
jgi:hypothetical protein